MDGLRHNVNYMPFGDVVMTYRYDYTAIIHLVSIGGTVEVWLH